MNELGFLLRNLRGKLSLREAAKKANMSHSYLRIIEQGKDYRTGTPVYPSPETLKSLSMAYSYSYDELMKAAGYYEQNKDVMIKWTVEDIMNAIENGDDQFGKEILLLLKELYKLPTSKRNIILDSMKLMIEN